MIFFTMNAFFMSFNTFFFSNIQPTSVAIYYTAYSGWRSLATQTGTELKTLLLLLLLLLVTTFVQGIYNYIPETNHISRVYSVAAILSLGLLDP